MYSDFDNEQDEVEVDGGLMSSAPPFSLIIICSVDARPELRLIVLRAIGIPKAIASIRTQDRENKY